jgi:membrane protease subunit HflK
MSKSPWDDLEEVDNIFTRKRNKINFSNFNNFNFGKDNIKIFLLSLAGILILWLASGLYKLKEGEQAVILRFGAFTKISGPGLNYHLPSPIEEIIIERVNTSRTSEIGYRSTHKNSTYGSHSDTAANESTMLTGDENIVNLSTQITWHINNLKDYVLNIKNPENTVKAVAQSVIREVIAEKKIASILSDKKQLIADQIQINMQNTLDKYGSGIRIEKVNLLEAQAPVEVRPAFIDVKTASADKQKEINQAYAYRNNILPEARGQSAKIMQEAEAYKQEVIEKAKGEAKRFADLLAQYTNNKEIMKQRIYLDTIEKILQKGNKVIIGNDVLSHMSLDKLLNKN